MQQIEVNAMATGEACEPYWKRMVCGDRAGLALRADYRECLAAAVRECGFQSLRQHGMFHDDMFLWHREDQPMRFQYLFSNYDYYLSLGLRPFVELSFMPRWMAAKDSRVFAVDCAASPPKDYGQWWKLVHETVIALVDRYGVEEVRSWHFEVWNEADIAFFDGTQDEYFELYRHAADAVKSVDETLRIGGPATSNFKADDDGVFRPVWVEAMIDFCDREHLPLDFVSTHPYPTDFAFDEAKKKHIGMVRDLDATHTDLKLLRKVVDAGAMPHLPIHCNEWGSSPGARDHVHDHVFSGSFLLYNLLKSVGLVDSMARWVFCDVSEERPPGEAEFHGGWGLMTVHGIRKPGFHAYAFLNRLGGTMLHNEDGAAVFRGDGDWQVLLHNHQHYVDREMQWETFEGAQRMIGHGESRSCEVTLTGLPPRVRLRRRLVDREHGWARPAWVEMGSPDWPTPDQLQVLHEAAMPGETVETHDTEDGRLTMRQELDAHAFALIEVEKA